MVERISDARLILGEMRNQAMQPQTRFRGRMARATRGAAGVLHPATADEVENKHHHCDHDQDVNETAGDVKGKTADPESGAYLCIASRRAGEGQSVEIYAACRRQRRRLEHQLLLVC